jgi:hypothetical protein
VSPISANPGQRFVARLSDNSERLYESDNGVLGRPHRSAASGRSGASETEMTQLRIDSLSLMYKKSPDPGNFPTASRHSARSVRGAPSMEAIARLADGGPDSRLIARWMCRRSPQGFGCRLARGGWPRPVAAQDWVANSSPRVCGSPRLAISSPPNWQLSRESLES